MKKAFMFGLLFLLFGIVGQAFADANEYENERYDFVVNWAEGNYTVKEPDNGDGIIVAEPKNKMEFRAFGSKSWDVLGMDFDTGVAEECKNFDKVTLKRINKEKGWFVLSGYKGNDIIHIKGLYTPDTVCEFIMHYPQKMQGMYAEFAEGALRSFRKTGDDDFSAWAGLSFASVRAEEGIDEHGCNFFQLVANENLELTARKVQLNEQDYSLSAGEVVQKFSLQAGQRCDMQIFIPESIPSYMLCVGENCWIPDFSGEDGSLILAPGFAAFAPDDYMPAKAVTKIHLPPLPF